jgi:dipeptidase E
MIMTAFLASMAWRVLPDIVRLLPSPPACYRVAFVPTAAHLSAERPWVDDDRTALVGAGFRVVDFDLAGQDEAGVRAALAAADLVFVAGGNTFVLLREAIRSGFRDLAPGLVRQGLIYVGSSAGALIAGPTVDPARFGDDPGEAPGLTDRAGLNLVNVVPLVHFGNELCRDEYVQLLDQDYRCGHPFVTLTDQQFLHARDDFYRVVGRTSRPLPA